MAEVLTPQEFALCQHTCHEGGYRPPATILMRVMTGTDPDDITLKYIGICDECQHVPIQLQKQIHHGRLEGEVIPFTLYFVQDTRLN